MFEVTKRRYTAYVIFVGSEHRAPWRIFTRRGWRHVMVLLPVQNGNSLGAPRYSAIINATAWTVMHEMYFEKPETLFDMAITEGATAVIKFPVVQQMQREYVFRGLLSCMTLTKALLGIRAWSVLTPYGLARYLLANGGSIVKVSNHGKSLRRQQKTEG